MDLSHQKGKNVNNGISPEMCTLQYTRVDHVVWQLLQLGLGALMVKLDIKSAYRIVLCQVRDGMITSMLIERFTVRFEISAEDIQCPSRCP